MFCAPNQVGILFQKLHLVVKFRPMPKKQNKSNSSGSCDQKTKCVAYGFIEINLLIIDFEFLDWWLSKTVVIWICHDFRLQLWTMNVLIDRNLIMKKHECWIYSTFLEFDHLKIVSLTFLVDISAASIISHPPESGNYLKYQATVMMWEISVLLMVIFWYYFFAKSTILGWWHFQKDQ